MLTTRALGSRRHSRIERWFLGNVYQIFHVDNRNGGIFFNNIIAAKYQALNLIDLKSNPD